MPLGERNLDQRQTGVPKLPVRLLCYGVGGVDALNREGDRVAPRRSQAPLPQDVADRRRVPLSARSRAPTADVRSTPRGLPDARAAPFGSGVAPGADRARSRVAEPDGRSAAGAQR